MSSSFGFNPVQKREQTNIRSRQVRRHFCNEQPQTRTKQMKRISRKEISRRMKDLKDRKAAYNCPASVDLIEEIDISIVHKSKPKKKKGLNIYEKELAVQLGEHLGKYMSDHILKGRIQQLKEENERLKSNNEMWENEGRMHNEMRTVNDLKSKPKKKKLTPTELVAEVVGREFARQLSPAVNKMILGKDDQIRQLKQKNHRLEEAQRQHNTLHAKSAKDIQQLKEENEKLAKENQEMADNFKYSCQRNNELIFENGTLKQQTAETKAKIKDVLEKKYFNKKVDFVNQDVTLIFGIDQHQELLKLVEQL